MMRKEYEVRDGGPRPAQPTALGTSQKTSETVKRTSPFLKPCHSSWEGDACVSRKKIILSFDKKTNPNFHASSFSLCIFFTMVKHA